MHKGTGHGLLPGRNDALGDRQCASAGADFVKLFPAEQLGVPFIKAVRGPLGHIPLLAVGGADEKNAGEFIRAGACGIGVGGKLVKQSLIECSDWPALEALAREFIKALS